MAYAKDRFFIGDATIEHYVGGKMVRERVMIYSYESHKDLFDVIVTDRTGRIYYNRNMRHSSYLPAHEEIMHHYGLKG